MPRASLALGAVDPCSDLLDSTLTYPICAGNKQREMRGHILHTTPSISPSNSINHIFTIAIHNIEQITRATRLINRIIFVPKKPLDHTVAVNHANALLKCRPSRRTSKCIARKLQRATPPPILLLIVLAPFSSKPPPFLPFESSKKGLTAAPAKRNRTPNLPLCLQSDPLFITRLFDGGGGRRHLALPAERSRMPEVLVGFPRRALARRHLLHHLVDLLEGEASRLRHEEVGPEDAAAAQPAPDEEDFGAEVAVAWVDHVGDNYACGES
jgi:hypothetical protein